MSPMSTRIQCNSKWGIPSTVAAVAFESDAMCVAIPQYLCPIAFWVILPGHPATKPIQRVRLGPNHQQPIMPSYPPSPTPANSPFVPFLLLLVICADEISVRAWTHHEYHSTSKLYDTDSCIIALMARVCPEPI